MAVKKSSEKIETKGEFKIVFPEELENIKPKWSIDISKTIVAHIYDDVIEKRVYDNIKEIPGFKIIVRNKNTGLPPSNNRNYGGVYSNGGGEYSVDNLLDLKLLIENLANTFKPTQKTVKVEESYDD